MAVVTGTTLLSSVRDYAEQPDEGQGAQAYVTDTQIYSRLTKEYRKLLKKLSSFGMHLGVTNDSLTASSTVTLSASPLCILSVYQDVGNTRRRLKRLVDTYEPLYPNSTQFADSWKPNLNRATGAGTISLYPTPTTGTIKVWFVAEPTDLSGASSIYLAPSWEDYIVLGAALRCYAKEADTNPYIKMMYEEAIQDIEQDASQFNAADGAVIRNSDSVYTPGCDQHGLEGYSLDPADFWFAP